MFIKKLAIVLMILIYLLAVLITSDVVGAYPPARDRCLEKFQPVTLNATGGGYETYTGSNGEYLLWQIGSEEIYVGVFGDKQVCKQNPRWQPGALALYIPMTSDCAYFEIDNLDGGWSIVEDENGIIIRHYGEPLFVSATGVTDVERYRAVEIECPSK